ncbi:MAG: signal peptidase I [Bacillota bacterium]|nr:signal peptidase I [Bacillota bacterium]
MKNKKVKKVINIIIDVLIGLVLITSIIIAIISLSSSSSGVPNLFGYAPMSVQSDSMDSDKPNDFKKGDLIISKVMPKGTEYNIGDIVTFSIAKDGKLVPDTHRIFSKTKIDGVIYYQTKGDNAPGIDPKQQTSDTIIAKYSGIKLSGFGLVLDCLKSQVGFFFAVLLPMALLFLYELYVVIMNLIAYNKEKAILAAEEANKARLRESGIADLTEDQMKQAVEQYLAKSKDESSEATMSSEEIAENQDEEI